MFLQDDFHPANKRKLSEPTPKTSLLLPPSINFVQTLDVSSFLFCQSPKLIFVGYTFPPSQLPIRVLPKDKQALLDSWKIEIRSNVTFDRVEADVTDSS